MRFLPISTLIAYTLFAGAVAPLSADTPVSSGPKPAGGKEGPCEQIVQACKNAGFIEGDVKEGNGLWVDCIDPIMHGGAQPAKAKIPLPSVSPDAVGACKQKHPNFGQPKQGKQGQSK
jgi:hypothetical protein